MKWMMRLYVIVFIALLAVGGVLVLVLPQHDFSENENRVLEEVKAPSVETYFNGEFQEKFETAVSDQFPLRDVWTGISSGIRSLMGLHDAGGVYLGKDHYYFEKKLNKDVPVSQYNKNIGILKRYMGEHPDTQVMFVPSPASILSDKLPLSAALYDMDTMYQTAEQTLGDAFIDVRDALKELAGRTQIFYRTDHHWTTKGAYAAYQVYVEKIGQAKDQAVDKSASSAVTDPAAGTASFSDITDSFFGTTYSKALEWNAVPDTIEQMEDAVPSDVKVTINGKTPGSVYVPDKLKTKDKYAYFFGGNYADVTIENPGCENDRELVIFKDSFANCFVPMLIRSYRKITMIDLRYETRPIRAVMKEHPNATSLVLYEISNFATSSEVARMGM